MLHVTSLIGKRNQRILATVLRNSAKMLCPEILSGYKHLTSTFTGTAAAFFYGTCSVSMAFINKTLMTTFDFDYPVFIMVMQMIFTICLLELLSILHLIHLPRYTLQRGKMFFLPALFYGVNSILGLNALGHMNVAMYGVLKRCVPLATMFLSVLILKKGYPSRVTITSVLLITGGCVIASYGDLKFNLYAYTCGALSNLTHSLYLLLVQKVTEKDLTTVETLQLNSFNTLPFLTAYSVFSGEINEVMQYKQAKNVAFIVLFFATISIGCMLNYSLFLCTSLTSALTTSVVGGVKALMQTVFGMFTFGGISHNLATYLGITVNMSGSIMYLYGKYKEGKQRATMGGILHKVISVSTAEDFKDLANGNGTIRYTREAENSERLHSIKEENSDHESFSESSISKFSLDSRS
ncbi:UDP-galactose/UDP-glucose transporter 7-like isoform X2 [Pecten maximus]|uniref:UDP-galactose/UDP-glucose transporter 7-like isoform X2 n=1 Tax=Pecten maximus TaxID=6579 RepID=UPI001458141C|nr:UDP-galactose/UDP-glucose transporter 7-like isoform X2 [Pecten maximus]